MTPEKKIAILQASYAAFNAGPDLDALLQLYDPECEWVMASEGAAFGHGRFLGHEGLRQFSSVLQDAMAVLSSWRVLIDEVRAMPCGSVLIRGHATARWIASDNAAGTMERPIWQQVDFRGDRILRVIQRDEPPAAWHQAEHLASY